MAYTPDSPLRPRSTRDEQSRQAFASSLRRHVLTRMAGQMRSVYDNKVLPNHEKTHGAAPADGPAIHKLMKQEKMFKLFSAVRTNAQEIVFASVIPAVEREMDVLAEKAEGLFTESSAGGSLTLNPELDIPRSVTAIDVHRAPGGYATEYDNKDIAAGVMYDTATEIFAFRQFGDDNNDIGMTMSNYVRLKYPDFKPQKILDCGCTVGHNTLPWAQTFPEAQVHAIDVAAPVLRFGSARAESLGVPVHFKQMNASKLDYPDASFDVVFSSMFLHELPLRDIHAYFAEAYRVLKPGGLLINMELPPNSAMAPYESFYLDWDCYYNNEPFYKKFRDQDYRGLCTQAGFDADDYLAVTLPRYTFVGEEAFSESLDAPTVFDSQTGRMDPKGTRWFGFGAFKQTDSKD